MNAFSNAAFAGKTQPAAVAPMRILHCLRAPVGGLFRHVIDLASRQAELGHAVGILADSNAGDSLTGPRLDAIAPLMRLGVVRIPIPRQPGIGDLSAARSVAAHARRLGVDVLHGHGAKGGAYARLASVPLRFTNVRPKVFYTPHGGSLNMTSGPLASRMLLGVERRLEPLSDGLIFESQFAANAYAARVGRAHVPIRVIHNGLAPADFDLAAADASATDLLFIGELRDIKGVDVLIDAIADVNRDRSVTATIVGAGPDGATLQKKVNDAGLAVHIRFLGALPARTAFRHGRIVVVPSLKESFPYVVLEAAAAGLPLIATNVGGIPEILAGSDTPMIEAGSRAALSVAIRQALADPERARERALRLRHRVSQALTVDAMTASVLDFYAARRA
ncbi:MAG: glycosyltransferase family 4 protein [Hyphomicrobium sp.]